MKLRSFHVREFRSVRDSGPIEVGDITCLVGKNEAGKTALLKALFRLNPVIPSDAEFSVTDDYPRIEVEDYRHAVESGRRNQAIPITGVDVPVGDVVGQAPHHQGRPMSGAEKKIPMQAIGTVRVPKDRLSRPWRPIPGAEGYGVTQTGQVWSEENGELWDADDWPRIWLTVGDEGLVEVNVMAAVALAWLTPEQRARIRGVLPSGSRGADLAVVALETELQISRHAVAHVTHKPEEDLHAVRALAERTGGGDRLRIEGAEVEDYSAFLHEHYRPPSQGGNTTALHVHRMVIGGQPYTFFARGSRKWVYKGDRVSFDYRVTPEGYRNLIRTTVVTQDKAGRPVVRGDRRGKATLRSAPTRLPAKRSEWKD